MDKCGRFIPCNTAFRADIAKEENPSLYRESNPGVIYLKHIKVTKCVAYIFLFVIPNNKLILLSELYMNRGMK